MTHEQLLIKALREMAEDCLAGQRTSKSDRWAVTLRSSADVIEAGASFAHLQLRDYLAGQALVAVLHQDYIQLDDFIARRAYAVADAMLEARQKMTVEAAV